MTEKEVTTESNGNENNENGGQQDETELEKAIIRQVEYYFGDVNLPRDKFLREQVKLDEGWVPFDVLLTFNRLSKLSADAEVIVKAINKSTSGLLEISDDNKKIRRNPEMPLPEMNEERRKEIMERSIYAKGFAKDSVLDDLLKFFKDHGDVENVIMRRYQERQTKKKIFKGSVFATFKTKEQAQKFLETKDLKYNDTDLLVRWQSDYLQEKQVELAARKEKKDKKSKDGTNKEEDDGKKELSLPTGTLLHFTDGNEKMTRENVTEALTPLGAEIAYIDFKVGDKEGWVRLSKEDAAKQVFQKITDGKLNIIDTDVTFRLLEGDEEKTYLNKTVEEISKRRKQQSKNKKGNWQNKGKYQGGRKRKQGPHGEAPSSKVKADS